MKGDRDSSPPPTTEAGGTHPTGMHTCFNIFVNKKRVSRKTAE